MVESSVVITAENGLHTRPAAVFVKAAKAYESDISVINGEKSANAKSLFKLQTLGLSKGCTIVIRADGTDAQAAVDELTAIVVNAED